jgi:glycosyltransferase involved in cell wall biosynthesis
MNKYKICAYAICKNETAFVDRWVDSLSDADNIIVCDTGSTDDTVKKLKDKGVTVYEIRVDPWRFDDARNISLGLIPVDTDICVCTDLDEIMEPGWRSYLEKAWTPNTDSLHFMFTFSFNPDGTRGMTFWKNKIHARKGYRWTHPIHEVLQFQEERQEIVVYEENIHLNHFPGVKESRSSYLPLLEQSVKEAPEDDRNMHYLGREYLYHYRWDDCIRTLKKHLSLPSASWLEERCASMRYIAMAYMKMKMPEEAKNWLYRAIGEAPHLREPYVELSKVFYTEKNWPGVYHMVHEGLKIHDKSATYFNEAYSWDYTLYDMGALSAFELGKYKESLEFAETAYKMAQHIERLKDNLEAIRNYNTNK